MGFFSIDGNALVRSYRNETLRIEPWGENGVRVRATKLASFDNNDWALLPVAPCTPTITIAEDEAVLVNGKLTVKVSPFGKIRYYNQHGKLLLCEYVRNMDDFEDFQSLSPLFLSAREYKPIDGDGFGLTLRFESDPNEKLFGMGQYQQPYLDLKGCTLELAQRNSQASVPFCLSDLGYGFLWNNPAVGHVTFGKNITEWHSISSKQFDFYFTCGDTPAEIMQQYAAATGTVPMMPEFAMGFWQCKLRYQTQDELLSIAREYKKRGIPLSVIVIDFFHWTKQGDWKFDKEYWPDPEAMVKELQEMGVELMVSVWPTVDGGSENYAHMRDHGYLARSEHGLPQNSTFVAPSNFTDVTHPGARKFIWDTCKRNYFDYGVKVYWLDVAEPEYIPYDFENYRYHIGSNLQTGNIYPALYAKAFYDGLKEQGVESPISLLRCAWAGSQRYGALVWSGDIDSSFKSMRYQVAAGLNMAIAGIPWWTTDIGGFHGAYTDDVNYRECIIRWFQYGAFCPVMRLHGNRLPNGEPIGTAGGGMFPSGAANEVWSYGDEALQIMTRYINLRYAIKPYVEALMKAASQTGEPPMRPMFYDFPNDTTCWTLDDQYMFGPDVIVAPVMEHGARSRKVYLPEGEWVEVITQATHNGVTWIEADAPLSDIPLFVRAGSDVLNLLV